MKWLRLIVLFCLVLSQLPIATVFAGVDITNPVFDSISLDKREVKVGDTINFTIKATDSESGLKDSGFLYYKTPLTEKNHYININYNTATGNYEGSLTMTEAMESGEWKVSWITIYDNTENHTTVYGPLENSNFTLSETTTDTNRPVFNGINIDKTDVRVGDTINFIIKATDIESGLKSSGYLYYKTPLTGKNHYININYNAGTGNYEGSLTMTEAMESGEWKVSWITIYDNLDNITTIYGPIDGGNFNLTGTSADINKPTIESISLDKQHLKVGDTVHFSIKAMDNESGLKSSGYLYYETPLTGKKQYINISYNATTGAYEGSLKMTETMEPGIWEVAWITIYDHTENNTTVYGPFEGTSFTLEDYTKDFISPSFNGMHVDKKLYETNAYAKLTVNAMDNTMVKSVQVNYLKPITGETESIILLKDADETFTANYYIPTDAEYGEWKVSSVEVIDLNNNTTTITSGLETGDFTVLKPIASLGHKFVMSNETWSYQTINGDVYIGPEAILTIDQNVTINGNVYVLGALRSYGGLTVNGALNARSISMGYKFYYYNGDATFSGSNYVNTMSATYYPLTEVPMELYETPLIKEDGRIDILGATIPVVDVYLDNQKLNVKSDGTFRFTDYYIGDRKEITFMFVDVFGKTTYKSYKVYSNDKPVVSIDKSDGIYLGNQYIELSLSKDGTIYYTLDGSEPTASSTVYSSPITLNDSTVLKYMAEDEIGNKSEIYSKNFDLFFVNEVTNASNTVTGKGQPGLTVNFTVNEQTYSAVINDSGTFRVEIPNLEEVKDISVSASDELGNVSSPYEIGVKDVIAPKVSGIEQAGIYNNDKIITFNEGIATLNSAAINSGDSVKYDGNYILVVTDDSGNETTVNFTIDKTAPVVSGVKNDDVYNQDVTINFNEGSAKINGETFTNGTVVKDEGDYSLEVTDLAGNITNVSFTIDKTAPVITGVENNKSYNQDVSVQFNEGIATLNGIPFTESMITAEGDYTLNVTDAGGNKTEVRFEIDKTAPKVSGVEHGGLYNKDVSISVNEGTAHLNGATFTSGTKVDEEGTYTLIVTDKAGNQTTVEFTIDKTSPIVSGVKNNESYNKEVVITFEEGTATLDSEVFLSESSVEAEGIHTLVVIDAAGNQTSVSFTIDKTAPQVSGVENEAMYNKAISLSFNEGTAKLNGEVVLSGTVVQADGSYTLEVIDEAGNKTVLTFIIDQTSPVVSGVIDNGVYNHNVKITFNEGTALLNGLPYLSGTEIDSEGAYKFEVTDQIGNKYAADFVIDKTPPVVNGVEDNAVYNQAVVLTFNEGTATLNAEPFKSETKVEAEGTYTLIVIDPAGNQVSNSFTIDKTAPNVMGAADNGLYNKDVTITFNEGTAELNGALISSGTIVKGEGTHKLVVSDKAGNKTAIQFTIDKTAPAISGVVNGSTYNKDVMAAFSEGTAVLNGRTYKSGTIVNVAGVYTLVVTDASGNKATVKFTIDKKAPNVPVINTVSDQSTAVSGKAEANSTVKLYIFGRYQKSVTADRYGNYKFAITKQKAGTSIKVTATDKAGNISSPKEVKVLDKTPPAIPTVNKVTYKTTTITGKAEKSATIYVYRGTTYLGKAIADSKGAFKVKIKAQKKGTSLSVYAKDAAGNKSGKRAVKVY
ncbi:Ig-like domain-containing protein [Fictibacillus aquaticus]|uniref:Bacterial Ig domain-containing protein n=1 Tax=Fictibacillus aquaticus TaxID=2021314 RepID=A0A235F8N5_9BACL|nr:Ig-like domain-containing protein [Fictibacillus aquaticus]OYD57628.1 hypothetical protein CGZ90_13260 [Fictibacillus aquaticus]